MNIKELESTGLIKINKKLPVQTIKSDKFIYNGQVGPKKTSKRNLKLGQQLLSQGFGREHGLWGIYEGEFDQGAIGGYGRMIYSNQN